RIAHWSAVGYRNLESRDPLERDDIFRIASMTKPVTSVAVMMLIEEGHLSLEDDVATHLPELGGLRVYVEGELVPTERPVTVADLLGHTSGMTYGFFGDTRVDSLYVERDLFSGDLANLVEGTGELPLLGQPGTIWNYSVATDVLGRLVEVASGMELDAFFRTRIFEPLGMDDTGFSVPPADTSDFVTLYTRGSGSLEVLDSASDGDYNAPPALVSGGGGLVSTASDYLRFAQMLLNGGELDGVRLLRPETVELMRTNRLPDELIPIRIGGLWAAPGYGFGLGFSVLVDAEATPEPDNDGVFRWWGYGSTYFWIDPAEELIGIVLTQLSPPVLPQLERRFQTLVYEALRAPAEGDHLYRVEMLRAAPGAFEELMQVIEESRSLHAEAGDPAPFWMRHSQGDQWDFMLLHPVGTRADYHSEERSARRAQAWDWPAGLRLRARREAATAYREDWFARGVPPEELRRRFDGMDFYHIEMFVGLPGERDALVEQRRMENRYYAHLDRQ
ncbi:MAG: serine hydrolase, partial [Gemmatimonadota bacterium]|nr:serine hydrolase [Gemmatimonadota bacterium]